MIEAIASRRFRLGGTLYEQGAPLSLPDNQFTDLAQCGLVERAKPALKKIAAPGNKPALAVNRAPHGVEK